MAAALADHLDADAYADFRTGQETTLQGERAWWRNIIPDDRERIVETLRKHEAAYKRLGYRVELDIAPDQSRADLTVRHRSRRVTEADVEILKGSVAATRVKSGWGGSG